MGANFFCEYVEELKLFTKIKNCDINLRRASNNINAVQMRENLSPYVICVNKFINFFIRY